MSERRSSIEVQRDKRVEGSAHPPRDVSSPACSHCGHDLRDILASIHIPSTAVKDSSGIFYSTQVRRCFKEHSKKEVNEMMMKIRQLKDCRLFHYTDAPVGVRDIRMDPTNAFYFVSDEIEKEADLAKRKERIQLLTKWMVCWRDHGEKNGNGPRAMDEKMKREEEGNLLDKIVFCIRDHRPLCTCRCPVDVQVCEEYVRAKLNVQKEMMTMKKRLFGVSQSPVDKEVEECTRHFRDRLTLDPLANEVIRSEMCVPTSSVGMALKASGTSDMTILPTTKAKKIRKEEKRAERSDEWSSTQVGQSCWSHSHGEERRGTSTLSHQPHSSHSSHSSHPSSLSPGPPRKMARTSGVGVSSSLSSLTSPSHLSFLGHPLSSTLPPSTQSISPRGLETRKEEEGPNSDDEYDRGFRDEEMERNFENQLRDEKGLEIKKMVGDGACLFRGVSHQIYGDEDMHGEVRRLCLDYMEKNREHFEQFITEDFTAYIARKRRPTVHGNHVELQAISEIYNRPIEIYEYNINPINVFHPKTSGLSSSGGGCTSSEKKEDDTNAPIRLSYHGSTHYNAVIDPRVATVGVGLGLPSYEPGLADRQLIAEAISKSEMHQIEQAMLHDKMSMTDWERTEEDLKDQVLRESYMEYARSLESSRGSSTSFSSRNAPVLSSSRPSPSRSPLCSSPQPCSSRQVSVPDRRTTGGSVSDSSVPPVKSSLYEELLMAEALEWNEDSSYESSLAEALIVSQQTFLTECTRKTGSEGGSKD